MPMTVIKGEYRVLGAAPDGDSIRFYPDAADGWERAGLPLADSQPEPRTGEETSLPR